MKCAVCNAYHEHSVFCPKLTEDQAKKMLKDYYTSWLTMCKLIDQIKEKANEKVSFWQGKYLQVKQENNALRKKLKAPAAPSET